MAALLRVQASLRLNGKAKRADAIREQVPNAAPPPASEHLQWVLISLVEFPAIQTSFQMMGR